MVPAQCVSTAPVAPPAYHRARAKGGPALHLDALTLITRLHLLALCRVVVWLAQRHSSPALLAAGPGGGPRGFSGGGLLLGARPRGFVGVSFPDLPGWLGGL